MTTGYAYHEVFGWHDTSSSAGLFPTDPAAGLQPFVHLENAETKRRLHELVVVSGLVDHLVADPDPRGHRRRDPARPHARAPRPHHGRERSCRRAATPATASRRSATAGSPSPGGPPAPSSRASTPCSTHRRQRLRARAAARPPRHRGERHGVLHVRQPRHRRRPRPGRPRRRSHRRRRLGRPPRQRHAVDVLRRPRRADDLDPPGQRASRRDRAPSTSAARAPGIGQRRSTSRCRPAPVTAATSTRSTRS